MLSDFNIRATFIIFITTLTVLGAHRFGLMDTRLNINSSSRATYVTTLTEGDAINMSMGANALNSKCKLIKPINKPSKCGTSIALGYDSKVGYNDLSAGIDLSEYDGVELEIKYNSPLLRDRVRISLRNFNEIYSTEDDFVSLKFNSVIFTPKKESTSHFIPFNSFRVEDWWIKSRDIDFEHSQVDFSNVAFIEVITDEMSEVGEYNFEISKIVFHGQLIDEITLLQLIILIWLIAIIALAVRQTKKLKIISNTDALTGLLNRRGITAWSYRKGSNLKNRRKGFLFYFDIDGFKKVNDTHGHNVGDDLLCELGVIVKKVILNDPSMLNNVGFSRLAGDEFVLILSRIDKQKATDFAEQIRDELAKPIVVANRLIKVSLSMGISSFAPSVDDFEDILTRADSAMYCAKRDGKNRYRFFDDHVRDVIYKRKQIAEAIRLAIENNEFSMAYMPIFKAKDLYIHKVEVLLRCSAAALDGIGPEQFIPIAEEFGVIQNIDLLVIETTFKHIFRNRKIFDRSHVMVCINISAKELNNVKFTSSLDDLLKRYRINPKQIELEITETSLVEIDDQSIKILKQIRNMGISLALDDFGTGYTAFSQIVNYPIDCLKIDKSFVDDLTEDNDVKKTLVKSILAIAKSFNLETVAEGIEKDEQFRILKELGCDSIQGYLLSKPISWLYFKALLEEQNSRSNVIKMAN